MEKLNHCLTVGRINFTVAVWSNRMVLVIKQMRVMAEKDMRVGILAVSGNGSTSDCDSICTKSMCSTGAISIDSIDL